jgi:hypothetical protein
MACRANAIGCCQRIRVNWTDSYGHTENFDFLSNAAQGGGDEFAWSNAIVRPFCEITCEFIGGPPVVGDFNRMILFDAALSRQHVFYSPGGGCPSLVPSDWTNWDDVPGGHYPATINSITCLDTGPDDPYFDAVSDDTPAGYWRRGETQIQIEDGTTTPPNKSADSSGHNRHGQYFGASSGWPTTRPPLIWDYAGDQAVRNGDFAAHGTADDFTRLPAASFAFDYPFTFETWAQWDAASAPGQRLFSIYNDISAAVQRELYFTPKSNSSNPTAELVSAVEGVRRSIAYTAPLGGGVYHLVFVIGGPSPGISRFYMNGSLWASATDIIKPPGIQYFDLGRGQTAADVGGDDPPLLTATLDEVALYDGELSADRVRVHWDIGTNGTPPGDLNRAAEFFRRHVVGRR